MPQCNTAVALGLFDGIHIGHQAVINKVVEKGKEGLVPSVFTFSHEEVPEGKKNFSYLLSESSKEYVLGKMGVEIMLAPLFDDVKSMQPEDFVKTVLVEKLKAKFVCCGYDFRFGCKAKGNAEFLVEAGKKYGFEVCVADAVIDDGDAASSTRIREFIEKGEIQKANHMLGRPFVIDFEVTSGRRLGTKFFHFPTINQVFPEGHVIPKFGVYAAVACIDGQKYPVAANVGVKPTVGSDKILSEGHIIGFSGDLYGQKIVLEFHKFLRSEHKFSSVEELKQQIARDKENIIEYFSNKKHLL